MPAANLLNSQTLQATIGVAAGANRLFAITGVASVSTFVSPGQTKSETWVVKIGPVLTRPQFHQAVATAAVTGFSFSTQAVPLSYNFSVASVEADWDDESGQVELRIELLAASSSPGPSLGISSLSFSATILAEL